MSNDPTEEMLGDPGKLFEGSFEVPHKSPVQPHQLTPDDSFTFHCHPGVGCFNECCRSIDITLTPYDLLRLRRRLGMTAGELVAKYSLPFEMDHHGLPGLKLRTKSGGGECMFLTEEGCSVYEDRPAACRYYALGSMGVRRKDSAEVEDMFFVVKEPHCLGHQEPKTQTVGAYRQEQGVDRYDEMNRAWRDVIIKKRSSGPTVGKPSERSMQLFDMCSYDLDSFRDFIHADGFQDVFDVDPQTLAELDADDEALLGFAMRFLKQVLFGELSIPVKQGAREQRLAKRREHIEQKRREEIERHKAHDYRDDASGED